MKNWRIVVAFDTDDCLIVPCVATWFPRDTPNYENIQLFKWFKAQGCYMVIWSGSGIDWAKTWAEKLWLEADEYPVKQATEWVDLTIDDCIVNLGKLNIQCKRENNQISRKEWNETKHLNPNS